MIRKEIELIDDYWPDCPYCDTPFYALYGEIDHINPDHLCGSNRIGNLILVCKPCNRAKGRKMITNWLREIHMSPDRFYNYLIERDKTIPDDLLVELGYIREDTEDD